MNFSFPTPIESRSLEWEKYQENFNMSLLGKGNCATIIDDWLELDNYINAMKNDFANIDGEKYLLSACRSQG